MRCPVCNEKIKKKEGICPGCSYKLPPEPNFIQKLMFLPIPEILFGIILAAGIGLLIYRLAIPTQYQEPIVNLSEQMEINSNVGVVFFDSADGDFIDDITSCIDELEINGNCDIRYKYNTDEDCYAEAIEALVTKDKCESIIITDNIYHNTFTDVADKFKDTDFYVLWGTDSSFYTPAENVQICRVDMTKAVYSIGVNSAHHLTELIKSIDVTSPEFSELNHTIMFLYKTGSGYAHYEQFVAGAKQINPNLGTYAVKVEDEAETAHRLAQSDDVYAVMVADEMPEFTKTLMDIAPEGIYLSGVTPDVTRYNNYLCAVTIDNSTYINHIFNTISDGSELGSVYVGTYDDSFCRLEYNTAILGKLN